EENNAVKELAGHDAALLSLERALKGKLLLFARNDALLRENEDIFRFFKKFTAENEEFNHILFAKTTGEYFESPKFTREKQFDPRNTVWYKDAIAAGESGMTLVMGPFEGLDGASRITFYSIVNPWGDTYGVAGISVDFAKLMNMTGDTENILVLDDRDTVVFARDFSGILFKKLQDANLGDLSLLGQKTEGISKCEVNGKNTIVTVYKSGVTKLKYIKLSDEDAVMKSARSMQISMLIAFALALFAAFFGSRVLMNRIKRSFKSIEEEAEAIEAGRLDEVGSLKNSHDEVGRISFAFGKMAGSVKSRLMTMETESQNLRGILRDVTDRLDVITENFAKLQTLPETLNNTAEAQNISVKSAASEIEELAQNFEALAKKEESGLEAIKEVDKSLLELLNQIDVNMMKQSEAAKAETERFAAELKNISQNICDVFSKIEDAAGELTLHALSAAVESARGNEGREKFAQIAEDMRKLSKIVEVTAKEGKKSASTIIEVKSGEYQALDIRDKLQETVDKAKEAEKTLEETEKIRRRLEVAGKSAKASAYDVTLREKETLAAIDSIREALSEEAKQIAETREIAKAALPYEK
ncbi:MAG: methyl-accepting chemotaxis protein, partial [Selenomonadaceae bacterium]|nr:methyl-accepting chemotaxis protein [Selenomonadaceae bacterium]